MASQKMTQTIRIVEKRGLAALLDRFFPDEEDDNKISRTYNRVLN